ncbi:hypothetical protein QE450_000905 [Paenibacillus sp. SORGH_AS306]|uniref:glycosyltransferase n=1 Tax=unclassified Paenibacillus TaxID=185978 RepID=UPI002783A6A2|nr:MULTISPECIES: glycosyltransferase [unclassified Paenibacillus]MDQ1233407.1 hypothetical protein [Paenibacillus sp. SORGH_AS_0306]MDR6110447.1 hypothetical protein [Paenibacillus sp. SORGH_AS_0338]
MENVIDSTPTSTLSAHYLRRLTDDTGIFQHTKFGIPDRSKGYTSDDNARALIAAVLLYKTKQDQASLDLVHTYLAFIYHAQNENGSFRNFMDYNRTFIEKTGSEDCQGRCLWALGVTIAEPSIPDNLQNTCKFMINRALPFLENIRAPRAIGYALIGLTTMLETPDALTYTFPFATGERSGASFLPRARIEALIQNMGIRLHNLYQGHASADWHWFEDKVTYGNAMLPWALFKASQFSNTAAFQQTARESLDFLAELTFTDEGYFKPIGSHGWLQRGKPAAPYDEQPIEASEMLMACYEAYKVLGVQKYHDQALLCYQWFHGRNSRNESLIDRQTGGCYDGIHAVGLNLNQGSENIVSYCMAHAVMGNE